MIADDLRQINHARPAAFLRRNVSNIGQNCLRMRRIIAERRPTEREGPWDERSVTPCV
jgi:hypothetical protein